VDLLENSGEEKLGLNKRTRGGRGGAKGVSRTKLGIGVLSRRGGGKKLSWEVGSQARWGGIWDGLKDVRITGGTERVANRASGYNHKEEERECIDAVSNPAGISNK